MWIFGDHGRLEVDAGTGRVVAYEPEGSEEYASIARFDLQEWRAYYAGAECDGGDILDFGYWLKDGTYEPPEPGWRAQWRIALRENS